MILFASEAIPEAKATAKKQIIIGSVFIDRRPSCDHGTVGSTNDPTLLPGPKAVNAPVERIAADVEAKPGIALAKG